MKTNKPLSKAEKYDNALRQRIDELLYFSWDPIGVCDDGLPEARNEYSSYVEPIYHAVLKEQSKEQIAEILDRIVIDMMEIRSNKKRHLEIAQSIIDSAEYLQESILADLVTTNAASACQVCGNMTVGQSGDYDVCPICFWEDDEWHEDLNMPCDSANDFSVNQAKNNFYKYGAIEKRFVGMVRPPSPFELPENFLETLRQYFIGLDPFPVGKDTIEVYINGELYADLHNFHVLNEVLLKDNVLQLKFVNIIKEGKLPADYVVILKFEDVSAVDLVVDNDMNDYTSLEAIVLESFDKKLQFRIEFADVNIGLSCSSVSFLAESATKEYLSKARSKYSR